MERFKPREDRVRWLNCALISGEVLQAAGLLDKPSMVPHVNARRLLEKQLQENPDHVHTVLFVPAEPVYPERGAQPVDARKPLGPGWKRGQRPDVVAEVPPGETELVVRPYPA